MTKDDKHPSQIKGNCPRCGKPDALPDAGWRDIESAPVGEDVWGYGTIGGSYGYTPDREDMAKTYQNSDGKWFFAQPMGRHDASSWKPRKWMPYPKPPEEE